MIYGTLNANGTFDSIEQGDALPSGAVEITAADALAMSQGRGHPCYKPDGSGGIMLDQAAAAAFDLDVEKEKKRAELNAACSALITGGFTSAALGQPYAYDSALEDQMNLIGAKSAGVALPYPCRDANGVKADRNHTAAQLLQVFNDGMVIKVNALAKCRTLKDQVKAATTVAAVQGVKW